MSLGAYPFNILNDSMFFEITLTRGTRSKKAKREDPWLYARPDEEKIFSAKWQAAKWSGLTSLNVGSC